MTIEKVVRGRILDPIGGIIRRQREQSQQKQQLEAVWGEIAILVEDIFPNDTVKSYKFTDPKLEWQKYLPSLVNLQPEIAKEDLGSISVNRDVPFGRILQIGLRFEDFLRPPYYSVHMELYKDQRSLRSLKTRIRVEVRSTDPNRSSSTQVYDKGDYVGEMLRLNLAKQALSLAIACKQSEIPL